MYSQLEKSKKQQSQVVSMILEWCYNLEEVGAGNYNVVTV